MNKAEKISTALVATFAIAAGGVACGGGEGSNASTDSPTGTRIELTESPFPPATETPTPILEQTPGSNNTPFEETSTPFDCGIFPQEYCTGGRLIDWENPTDGTVYKIVTLNVPAEIPILAPFDGQLTIRKSEENPFEFNAPLISIYNDDAPNTPIFGITGNIAALSDLNPLNTVVKKGDLIGYVQEAEENISGRNIIISFSSLDPLTKTFTTDESLIRQYFPTIAK